MKIVDAGIKNVTKLFRDIFGDEKTAFIVTADHGMSNRGSHGAGAVHETETPIIAWGAGVNHWRAMDGSSSDKVSTIANVDVPRFDVKQADVAPLMSALIGDAVPVNNVGQMPHVYLNATEVSVTCLPESETS